MFRIASAAIAVTAGVNATEAEWGMDRAQFSGFSAPQFQRQQVGYQGGYYQKQPDYAGPSKFSRPSRPEFSMPQSMSFERPSRPSYGGSNYGMSKHIEKPDTQFGGFGRPSAPERPSYDGFSSGFKTYGSQFSRPDIKRPDTSYDRPSFMSKSSSFGGYQSQVQVPHMPQRPTGKGYYGYQGDSKPASYSVPIESYAGHISPGYSGLHKPATYAPLDIHKPNSYGHDLHIDDGYTDLDTGLDHPHDDHHDDHLDLDYGHAGCGVKFPISDSENAKDLSELIRDYGSKDKHEIKEYYAQCDLFDPAGESGATGSIKFFQKSGEKIQITGTINNISEGKHGFHVHTYGDLSNGCASTGGHFNPDGVDHGSAHDHRDERHVGDLKQAVANAQGVAEYKQTDAIADLYGPDSIVGRGLVLHAGEDDLGDGGDAGSRANGNAGPRIACCIIGIVAPFPQDD